MADVKLDLFKNDGARMGYFLNPRISSYPEDDYEITGRFYTDLGEISERLEFNPQALPYSLDLSNVKGAKHKRLVKVYVQRGRQPVKIIGVGAN